MFEYPPTCLSLPLPHRKKSFSIFPSGMSLTRLSLGGNNLYMTALFPPRESLVSDIPARDGNIEKLFLRCDFFSFSKLKKKSVSISPILKKFIKKRSEMPLLKLPTKIIKFKKCYDPGLKASMQAERRAFNSHRLHLLYMWRNT